MLAALALTAVVHGVEPIDEIVQVEVDTSSGALELTFDDRTGFDAIEVWRRAPSRGGSWYSGDAELAATLPGDALSWTDPDAVPGDTWEYRITRRWEGSYDAQVAFVTAAFDAPPIDDRGTALVLVAASIAESPVLADAIDRLHRDLVGDGWVVDRRTVPADATPPDVKATIAEVASAAAGDVAVLLLGHVPVPYSGYIYPDGHTDHVGAWAADTYYAELDDAWTDTTVDTTSASRDQNDNVPGDGKFDNSSLISDADLQVGRVDMFDLATMGAEEDLLLRYLDKDHAWRHGEIEVSGGVLIDDNFGSYAPGSKSGWALAPIVGRGALESGDWLTTLPTTPYRFAYGSGGGWYQGASGVTDTTSLASTAILAPFTFLFGSYFGDWDSTDNVMRAVIAADGYTLTCGWAGRPNWFVHAMGAGATIGEAARWSMNNTEETDYGARGVHVALLGDPTLRAFPVAPPGSAQAAADEGAVTLTWTASPADDLVGYHVYRSTEELGAYERVTTDPVTGTSYTDTVGTEGTYWYMIRAVATITSPSGTFGELSQGVFTAADVVCEGEGTACESAGGGGPGGGEDGGGGGCGCATGAPGAASPTWLLLAAVVRRRRP